MQTTARSPKLFEFEDYKRYLIELFDSGAKRDGARSRFAHALGCQPAYLSRVLNGDAHLSPEQVDRASVFLGHTANEERYFFFLVLCNRASTRSLQGKLDSELRQMREQQLYLKNRVPLRQPLSLEGQVMYYSAWYFTAIHMLLDIDEDWTPQLIARQLGLSKKRVSEVLSFLVARGLVELQGTKYRVVEKQTHLDAGSALVAKHHINWRLKAIQNLEKGEPGSLHYSSVISASLTDIPRIREILLDAIEEIRRTVRASSSKDEALFSYGVDLFPLYAPESIDID